MLPCFPRKSKRKPISPNIPRSTTWRKALLHGTLHFKTLLHEVPGAERARFSSLSTRIDETSRRYILVGDLSLLNPAGADLLGLLPGKLEDAIPVLEKTLVDNPDREPTLVALGRAYCSVGRPKDAVAILEKALAKNPDHSPEVHLVLGDAYLAAPDTEKALLEYKKALGANPAPSELNSVAYSLADANVGLSDALAFSMRAATTIASESLLSPLIMPEALRFRAYGATRRKLGHAWLD